MFYKACTKFNFQFEKLLMRQRHIANEKLTLFLRKFALFSRPIKTVMKTIEKIKHNS